MDVLIRDAVDGDASALASLLTQLGYPSTVDDTAHRITRWRDNPWSRVIVAALNERVVGVLAFHVIPFFEQEGNRGRVVCLVVDEQSRGHGIGARLMSFIEAEARRLGCKDIELTSSRTRSAAHAFYRNIGYQDCCTRSARFLRPLNASSN
ncbi:hypothetical protein GCM10029978_033150 [Actinoallomurus acanthiterrae]